MKSTVAAGGMGCLMLLFPGAATFAAAGAAASATPATTAAATPDQAIERGAATFRRYCVLCHGEKADGSGVAAKAYNPRPANLTISPYSDDYKKSIIRGGGESVGRSPSMPPWGKELSDTEIEEVVVYLGTIKVKQAKEFKAP